jgi:glycosyltransferase involved in cell wall biosynthesis
MRICLFTFRFAPFVGGAEAQAEKLARQLQSLGNQVTVLTLRHRRESKRKEMLEGLPIIRVGGLYRRDGLLRIGRFGHLPVDIAMLLTLWRLRHSYDAIYAVLLSPPAVMAALIGQLTRKPVVLSIASTGPSEVQRRQLEREGAVLMADTLTDASFLRADFKSWRILSGDIDYLPQLALGNTMVRFLRKSDAFYQILSTRSHSYLTSHGFRAEHIIRVPNGVDTERFHPAPGRRPDPARPGREIVCVARFDYTKGVDVLLHAWGRMMREAAGRHVHLKPRLLLAGDGPIRPQLERIVEELGIRDSVEFLGLRTDVVDLLQKSWGFVLPSRWEGMPNALLEAMACGLPCVATRVSGSEDIITDGVNGLLVEPERPAELAQALYRIVEDTDLAQRLGSEARAAIVGEYQLTNVTQQLIGLYRRLLAREKVFPLAVAR